MLFHFIQSTQSSTLSSTSLSYAHYMGNATGYPQSRLYLLIIYFLTPFLRMSYTQCYKLLDSWICSTYIESEKKKIPDTGQ